MKLILGEDIRFAFLPFNCSIIQLTEIAKERFPNSEAILMKYKDEENDIVTITTTEVGSIPVRDRYFFPAGGIIAE